MNKKNTYLKWFSVVVWVGVLPNLYFAFPALFVPSYVVNSLGLNTGFETVWLRNAGLLIFIITFYHILAAIAPEKYPAVGWLVIAGRLLAVTYWVVVVLNLWDTSSNPSAFISFIAGDLIFGGASAVLLYLGLRKAESMELADSG